MANLEQADGRGQGGRGVAQSGRIRHKMWLGMALVVGIMAILLTGTLKGMEGYRQALRSLECKLAENSKAVAFQTAVNSLPAYVPRDFGESHEPVPPLAMNENIRARKLREAVKNDVRPKLEEYREALQRTLDRVPVSERKIDSQQYLACKRLLDDLETSIGEETSGGGARVSSFGPSDPLPKTDRLIKSLGFAVTDLISNLNDDMLIVTHQSYRSQRVSLIILVSSSIAAVVCMIGTLRFFYRRLLKPIRLLEQGVTRVARGDFEHRIDIKTGDEIESFANAYNDMTGKLNSLYRDLASQVNERSRQLVRSERLAGVGFLAAGVAHEINNPLASIAFCGEALESRLAELFDGRSKGNAKQDRDIVEKYLKMIQEEAFRCKEITQKLLAFSRGGDRKREKTDLNEIVLSVLDMVQHVPNSKGKTINFTPAANLEAWVSAPEIKQVFLNLVVNALDSMDEGGTVSITHAHRGDTLELLFKDSGCGMSEETLENIFEPFFTRSRTGKGTGLGLSISHRIITAHGGEIEASSPGPNQGSTFLVRLPTAEPANNTGEEEPIAPEEEFVRLNEAQHRRAA
jgi:two-component system, NtrC family, sensor kinase